MIGDREGVLTFFDDVELEYPRLAVDWDSIRKTILSKDFLQVTFFGGGTIGRPGWETFEQIPLKLVRKNPPPPVPERKELT